MMIEPAILCAGIQRAFQPIEVLIPLEVAYKVIGCGGDIYEKPFDTTGDDRMISLGDDILLKILLDYSPMLRESLVVGHEDKIPSPSAPVFFQINKTM